MSVLSLAGLKLDHDRDFGDDLIPKGAGMMLSESFSGSKLLTNYMTPPVLWRYKTQGIGLSNEGKA